MESQLCSAPAPVSFAAAVRIATTKDVLGGKGLFHLTFTICHPRELGKSRRRELEEETNGGMLLVDSPCLACSATFLTQPRLSCPAVAAPAYNLPSSRETLGLCHIDN